MKVHVRGVGAVTPLGPDWDSSVRELARGRSAVATVRLFDATGFPCSVAAEIPGLGPETPERRLRLAQAAAREAWRKAGVSAPGARIGVFVGAESGRASFPTIVALAKAAGGGAAFDHRLFEGGARPLVPRIDAREASPATVTSVLAAELGATGPARTVSLACSSSSVAIAEAARAIRQGLCDVALAGGVGADVDPLMLAGFAKVDALSKRGVSCPFDVRRDGFVVGEGAAFVVLAREKGDAAVELAGWGRSLDAHHLTAPEPEGRGAERAMRAALATADAAEIDYVQAHGTSTPLNDAIEAAALGRVFGERLPRIAVSSVKGALGHWIAGAGALGFLCGWEAVRSGTLLPTAGLKEPDPRCALDHVQGEAASRPVRAALVNAFAFGGANGSLVLRRCS